VTETLGMIAAVILPFWNIPLILKIRKRGSSGDISPQWACGVFGCLTVMIPSGLRSPDPIFQIYTIINYGLFSLVVAHVIWYRPRP
jgi:uncharacterized protein with PQ loop repeat